MGKRKNRPIIYRNGYPGVGKRTIANELCQLLPNTKVISNHLLTDTVAAVFDKTTREHELLYKAWRSALLSTIGSSTSTQDTTWIFIDHQSSTGRSTARSYLHVAAVQRSPFISVILNCYLDENLKRAMSGDRGNGNTELNGLETLRGLREREDIFRFGHELEMELGVTDLSPAEAARKICDHTYKVAPNNLADTGAQVPWSPQT